MQTIYEEIEPNELRRIERIEALDERELLQQLLKHYCICVANNFDTNITEF